MQAELREKLKAIIMVQPGSKIDGAEYALSLMEAAYNLGIQQSDGDRWVSVKSDDEIPNGEWQLYLEEAILGSKVHTGNKTDKFITIASHFSWDAPKITHYRNLPSPPTK